MLFPHLNTECVVSWRTRKGRTYTIPSQGNFPSRTKQMGIRGIEGRKGRGKGVGTFAATLSPKRTKLPALNGPTMPTKKNYNDHAIILYERI